MTTQHNRSSKRLSPQRILAEDIRRNPRLAPVVGQVLDLLGSFVDAHPNTKVRHVEEFARCELPNGDRHRAGFVAYTANGVVVVWKQGFLWRGNGQYVLDKSDVASSDWDRSGLIARLIDGSVLRIDWLAGSPERVGAEAAFDTFKPLPR